MPLINIDELFDEKTEIRAEYRGAVLAHTFRQMTPQEYLDYSRRASNFQVRKRSVTASEEAAGARLWLYDKLCEKVEVVDGDERQPVPEFKTKIPAFMKDQVATKFLSQVEIQEDEAKNS
jgi:hypothetical protein